MRDGVDVVLTAFRKKETPHRSSDVTTRKYLIWRRKTPEDL